uniref:ATP synthase F0 subunit 8 n=1 Tax=Binodoxys acalephae TaxID=55900 RepID=UPI002434E4EF|nr:ATP synthase F0 subunit 8 [Binodoxys acalephae]WEX30807.1 ATP synthase F0 subunit 8 [Binodoxys acalephae]
MPQMSSMDWLMLMIYFLFIFYLFMMLIYFLLSINFSKVKFNLDNNYFDLKWY